jgi:hypothetical protein
MAARLMAPMMLPVRQTESCRADLMTVSGQFSCPPPGSSVAASGQFVVSAVSTPGHYLTLSLLIS